MVEGVHLNIHLLQELHTNHPCDVDPHPLAHAGLEEVHLRCHRGPQWVGSIQLNPVQEDQLRLDVARPCQP